jgi:hypothetical protein
VILSRLIRNQKLRVRAGWCMFLGSLLAWPFSLWLTDEPPFILSLSWWAIILEAWNMVQIAEEAKE